MAKDKKNTPNGKDDYSYEEWANAAYNDAIHGRAAHSSVPAGYQSFYTNAYNDAMYYKALFGTTTKGIM